MPVRFSGFLVALALLLMPVRLLADGPLARVADQTQRPIPLDAGSLGLLGAGLVILALGQVLRRRS